MILYVCKTCGRYGGMGLALAGPFEQLVKALKGEPVEPSKPDEVPCPDGHGRMYEVQENDRLTVLDVIQISSPEEPSA